MRLYLVRHAKAVKGTPDDLRPLTKGGRKQARALGARLRDAGVRPDAILTSPLMRARETAELLGRELGLAPTVDQRLAPGATVADVIGAAGGRGETVVVVGHQPDCSHIAAALTGGPEPAFPPGGSFAVTVEP